jgi:membrane protease YdiL (CAAX protease family)
MVLFTSVLLTVALMYFGYLKEEEGRRSIVYLYYVSILAFLASIILATVLFTTICLQYKLHNSDLSEIYLNTNRMAIFIGGALSPLIAYFDRDVLSLFNSIILDGKVDIQRLWFPLENAQGFLAALGLIPAFFIAAFAEELFRAYILVHLKKATGIIPAVLISSLLFTFIHILHPLSIHVMMPIFVSGILFAIITVISKSIWPSVFAHCLSNLMAGISLTSRAEFGNQGVTALDISTFPFY